MSKTKSTRCSECGGTVGPFTTYVNASTAETHYVCNRCSAEESAASFTDLAEIDAHIAEIESGLAKMEPMLKQSNRKEDDLPAGLAQFVQTPMSMYKSMQDYLAALKTRRIELIGTTRNPEKLQYELDKLVSDENYEEAALLKKEMEDLRTQPAKKSDLKEKKSKVLFQNTDKTSGKCVSCKTNYPKAPGLFQEFEDPKVHQMCLPCIANDMISLVRTVKMADYMIEEMEGHAKMTDGLSTLGKLMQMDQKTRDKFRSIDDLPKTKSNTQRFNEKFIGLLKEHRDFLALIKEDPKDIAQFINMHEKFNQLSKEDKELFTLLSQAFIKAVGDAPMKPKQGSPKTGKKKKP